MQRTTVRTSARWRRCECGAVIVTGERYLEHVISPHHDDIGNTTWWRMAECVACAYSKGRGELLGLQSVT